MFQIFKRVRPTFKTNGSSVSTAWISFLHMVGKSSIFICYFEFVCFLNPIIENGAAGEIGKIALFLLVVQLLHDFVENHSCFHLASVSYVVLPSH